MGGTETRCILFALPFLLCRCLYFTCEYIVHLILLVSAKWEGAFAISCVAVSLDPLFFYIPIIDETNKCLKLDKELRTIALVLRTLMDIPLMVHFIYQLCRKVRTDHPNLSDSDSDHSDSETDPNPDTDDGISIYSLKNLQARTSSMIPSWLTPPVVMNFLAVLPIPQVVILIGFFRVRSTSGHVTFLQRTFVNVLLVLQYLPRVCQIYLSGQRFRMGAIWIKPSLYLFLYIIGGHVFAAFWYFFGIERETSCWHQACRNTPGCVSNFYCGDIDNSSINLTIIGQLCPINSPNITVFDFGIYLPLLQSGNTGAVNFFSKLFYSLWWGLRNLSNFGTNLVTSNYMWENCFAILICISGLLLFLCLIGNVQKYVELATTKSLKSEESRRKKIVEKKKQINTWLLRNSVDGDLCATSVRIKITKYIKLHRIVQKDIKANVDLNYFLVNDRFPQSINGTGVTSTITIFDHLKMSLVKNAAKNVLVLENMNAEGWKSLCKHMKPVIYSDKDTIVEKEGQELVEMIFIVEGDIECNNMITHHRHLKKGDCYDIRLQNWAVMNHNKSYYDPLPASTECVTCQTKVEAFALRASDLIQFIEENITHLKIEPEQREKMAEDYRNGTHPQANNQDNYDQHVVKQRESPEEGLVKLNISVVWDSDSKLAKMGCVCRDSKAAFMMAGISSITLTSNDAFLADARGMAKAIEFCHQNVDKLPSKSGIVVESDNYDLTDCLNRPLDKNKRISKTLMPVLKDIQKFASKFKSRTFMHCSPQGNRVANCLANRTEDGNNSDVSAFFEPLPTWLDSALEQDKEHDAELGIKKNESRPTPSADHAGIARHDGEDLYGLAEDSQL